LPDFCACHDESTKRAPPWCMATVQEDLTMYIGGGLLLLILIILLLVILF
jgi:hypothetical protein